jgi:hypothetical protein
VGDEGSLLDSGLCRDGGGIDQSAVRSIPAPLNENGGPLRGGAFYFAGVFASGFGSGFAG